MRSAAGPKPLWRIALETTEEAEEAVIALFESLFQEMPSSYTDVENGVVTVSVFVSRPPMRRTLELVVSNGLARLRDCGLNPGVGRPSVGRVRKEDWAESWKRHFQPFTVGSRLLIKPSWSRRKPAPGQPVIVLDPGLSFGTGQHPTTRFCLEQLVMARDPRRAQSMLDVGAGSGILAIAAAKLGYRPVRAFDVDPTAVRVARQNARTNGARVVILRADLTKMPSTVRQFDVVCANLTADLLKNCTSRLKRLLKPRGMLVLAGILNSQVAEIRKRFKARGFVIVRENSEGEWASVALARRKQR